MSAEQWEPEPRFPSNFDVNDQMRMQDAPEWAKHVLSETIKTRETLESILTKFDEVTTDLKPTIDKLTGSTMFRMLAGGK